MEDYQHLPSTDESICANELLNSAESKSQGFNWPTNASSPMAVEYKEDRSVSVSEDALSSMENLTVSTVQLTSACEEDNRGRTEIVVAEDTVSMSTYASECFDLDVSREDTRYPIATSDATCGLSTFPESTQYGQIELNNSNKNHIGPKYIASNITVVHPKENQKESPAPAVPKWRRFLSCKAVFGVAVLLNLFVIVIFLNSFTGFKGTTKSNNKNQISNSSWLIPRDAWGATPATVAYDYQLNKPIEFVSITQTNTIRCVTQQSCAQVVKQIQTHDIQVSKDVDISYNFLVGGDGNIYEGRGWKGAISMNASRDLEIRVAFIGDFSISGRADALTKNLTSGFSNLLNYGLEKYLSQDFVVAIECCSWSRPTFVGYNLFHFYFEAFYPVSCIAFDLYYDKYTLCEYNNSSTTESIIY